MLMTSLLNLNFGFFRLQDFVRRLLVVDARKRMTAKQALQHPWMLGSEKDLAKNDLSFNQEQLRVFNATAKLRAAIKSVRGFWWHGEGRGGVLIATHAVVV